MEQAVYIDTYFFTNFLYDFSVLYICGKIIHRQIVLMRLIASAVFGALWACFALLEVFYGAGSVYDRVIVSCAMVVIAFNQKSISGALKNIAAFLAVSFGIAGGIFALGFTFRVQRGLFLENGYFYFDFPYLTLILFFIISAIVYNLAFKIIRFYKSIKYVQTLVYQDDKYCKVKCLVDSGNLVKEPIFGKYVVICLFDKIKEILSEDIRAIITDNKDKNPSEILCELNNSPQFLRFSVSPCNTVENNKGILLTYRPDMIYIDGTLRRDAILGINFSKMDKDFDGLVSSELLS